jgi:hypothetical protein
MRANTHFAKNQKPVKKENPKVPIEANVMWNPREQNREDSAGIDDQHWRGEKWPEEIGRRKKKQELKSRIEGPPQAQYEQQQGWVRAQTDKRDGLPKGRHSRSQKDETWMSHVAGGSACHHAFL